MTDLIERLEAAEAGSRELDGLIEGTIGPESVYPGSHLLGGFSGGRKAYLKMVARHYTTSVDDALGLVPEGWCWDIMTEFDGITASIWPPGNAEDYPDVTAPTPALALCIAILKAREAEEG